MKRSKEIVIVSHCVINSNAKVEGLSEYKGVFSEVMDIIVQRGAGIIQLPCPETILYGIKRWGHVKEQFDTPHFRRECRNLIRPVIDQISNYKKNGYNILGIIGIDGSPSCGVNKTCSAHASWGGEFMGDKEILNKIGKCEFVDGPGVFMEEIIEELAKNKIDIPLIAIDESDVKRNISKIKKFFE